MFIKATMILQFRERCLDLYTGPLLLKTCFVEVLEAHSSFSSILTIGN